MDWWMWALMGLALLLAEVLTPGGLVLLFFGLGALLVTLWKALPFGGPPWVEWLLFSVLSLLSLAILRRPLQERFKGRTPERQVDSLVGETVLARAEIPAGDVGQVELRGTTWRARNLGERSIAPGQKCVVAAVDGVTLCLRGH